MLELLVLAWNTARQREMIRKAWMVGDLQRPAFHTIERGDAQDGVPTVGIAVGSASSDSRIKERLLAADIEVTVRAACQKCGGLLNACACR